MASFDVRENIRYLGHDGFKLSTSKGIIYTDPWQIEPGESADIIFISHEHPDHCSPEDVSKIAKDGTTIVTTAGSAAKLTGDVRIVKPGDRLEVKGVAVEVTPAYNVNKFRPTGQPFHPKGDASVAFVISVDGVRIYFAGDTDAIPEMDDLKPDIALLPVSGTYVMTADEAIEAVGRLKPKAAVPMHYGRVAGTLADAEKFADESSKRFGVQAHVLDVVAG